MLRPREGARTIGPQKSPGVIEMEVAHRDDVDGLRVEARVLEGRDDPRPLGGAHRAGLLVEPLADAGLDEDATGGRLDQQAVERLEEAVLVVDLVGDPAVPQQPGHRPEQRPGVRAERAGLDERNARAAAEVARPVDRVVHAQAYSRGATGSGAGLPARVRAVPGRRVSGGAAWARRPDRRGTDGSGRGTAAGRTSRARRRTADRGGSTSARR